MKCLKCGYLGFKTGSRCVNCGFDFSLLVASDEVTLERSADPSLASDADWFQEMDESLGRSRDLDATDTPIDHELQHLVPRSDEETATMSRWSSAAPERTHASTAEPTTVVNPHAVPREPTAASPIAGREETRPRETTPPVPDDGASHPADPDEGADPSAPVQRVEPDAESPQRPTATLLPLFRDGGDLPGRLRAQPRAPLAVRRTPHAGTGPARHAHAEGFEPGQPARPSTEFPRPDREGGEAATPARPRQSAAVPSKRIFAAVLDLVLLAAVSALVVALTLRMLELPLTSWRQLPVAPMAGFLALLAFVYAAAFTAIGGQTIGMMAAGVRVVRASGDSPGAAVAVRRTLAGVVTLATLGLGFLPALFGSRRLALHDRVTGTRVVDDHSS